MSLTNEKTPEQEARELLARLHDCAQYNDPEAMSTGDIVELANLFREVRKLRRPANEREPPHCSTCACGAVEPKGYCMKRYSGLNPAMPNCDCTNDVCRHPENRGAE